MNTQLRSFWNPTVAAAGLQIGIFIIYVFASFMEYINTVLPTIISNNFKKKICLRNGGENNIPV
jgi:hypothetical protein